MIVMISALERYIIRKKREAISGTAWDLISTLSKVKKDIWNQEYAVEGKEKKN